MAETQTPNREELFHMAYAAAKKGQRNGAKMMLRRILAEDKKNIRAMMLLARLSGGKERREWYERVLDVDPDFDDALDELEKMDYQLAAKRNMTLYKVGVISGAVLVVVVALLIIVSALAA